MLRVEIAGSHYQLGLEYGHIVSENKLNWWWTQPTGPSLRLSRDASARSLSMRRGSLKKSGESPTRARPTTTWSYRT